MPRSLVPCISVALLLITYLPSLFLTFGVHDDYGLLAPRTDNSFWGLHVEMQNGFLKGRPLQRLILALQILTLQGQVANLAYWRISSLAACIAAFLLSSRLVHSITQRRFFSYCLTFCVFTTAFFQESVVWVVLGGNVLPVLFLSIAAYQLYFSATTAAGNQTSARTFLRGYVAPTLLLMTSFCVYQPAAAFFLFFAIVQALFANDPALRIGGACRAVAIMSCAMALYYLSFRFLLKPLFYGLFPAIMRSAESTLLPYQQWVFSDLSQAFVVLGESLRLAAATPCNVISAPLTTAFAMVSGASIAAAWARQGIRAVIVHAGKRFVALTCLCGSIVLLSIAPLLVARGGIAGFNSLRTIGCCAAVIVAMQFWALCRTSRRPRVVNAVLLSVAVLFWTVSTISVHKYLTVLSIEYGCAASGLKTYDGRAFVSVADDYHVGYQDSFLHKKLLSYNLPQFYDAFHVPRKNLGYNYIMGADLEAAGAGIVLDFAGAFRDRLFYRIAGGERAFTILVPTGVERHRWPIIERQGSYPVCLVFRGDPSRVLRRYELQADTVFPFRMPSAWRLLGADDKKDWTVLSEERGQDRWMNGEERSYAVIGQGAYRYYAFHFLAGNDPCFRIRGIAASFTR